MKKKESNKKQIISLLILVIFIFSTLGFALMQMNSTSVNEQQDQAPFKPCVNASECILICDNTPLNVNCTNNMCDLTECP